MSSVVHYDSTSEKATIEVTFLLNGVPANPTAVTCAVTDPAGGQTVHSYQGVAPADITRGSTGVYSLAVTCSPSVTGVDGLWSYTFIGTGTVTDVQPGTWRVHPLAQATWYVGAEELKDRLGITGTTDDSVIVDVCESTSRWIDEFCGRHFYRASETRTYMPENVWLLVTDDIVSVTTLKVDLDGDGTFETTWTEGTDFVLLVGENRFNKSATGTPRPYTQVQALRGGNTWFPFTWPFTRQDRVQVAGVFGWPQVPTPVHQAALLIAADWVKMKDAPWGVAGISDLGVVRTNPNPWITDQLRPYFRPRGRVGV